MSVYRRLLIIAKLLEDSGASLVLEFLDGIVTLNHDGKGNKTTVSGSEVILSA